MSTLAELKTEIADDLDRTDLTDQIAREIGRAIKFYQSERFYFNETRDVTFPAGFGQSTYAAEDSADIPNFIEIDQVFAEGDSWRNELERISSKEWEDFYGVTGSPTVWSYFNQSISLYPAPSDVCTIRLVGHIRKAAPADDSEENNVWMVEAFDLIRARVCASLGLKKLRNSALFQAHSAAEAVELRRLQAETAGRVATGFVTPSDSTGLYAGGGRSSGGGGGSGGPSGFSILIGEDD